METFDRISYTDLISGNFDPGVVRGKIVMIGLTATGSGDQHLIPLGGQTEPGIVALSNVLLSVQNGVFIREASQAEILLSLLPLAAVMMYSVPRFNVRLTVLLLALAAAGTYLWRWPFLIVTRS